MSTLAAWGGLSAFQARPWCLILISCPLPHAAGAVKCQASKQTAQKAAAAVTSLPALLAANPAFALVGGVGHFGWSLGDPVVAAATAPVATVGQQHVTGCGGCGAASAARREIQRLLGRWQGLTRTSLPLPLLLLTHTAGRRPPQRRRCRLPPGHQRPHPGLGVCRRCWPDLDPVLHCPEGLWRL